MMIYFFIFGAAHTFVTRLLPGEEFTQKRLHYILLTCLIQKGERYKKEQGFALFLSNYSPSPNFREKNT
jgi:hypothetical protein